MKFLSLTLNRLLMLLMISISALTACDPSKTGLLRDPGGLTDESVPYSPGQSSFPPGLGQQILLSYSGSYALLIGESQYTNGWSNLETIPGELQKVEDVLKKRNFHVEKYLNLDAKQLRARFTTFINQYDFEENNRLLFFFSGHGYTRKYRDYDKGYIVPVDAPLPDSNLKGFREKAVSMDQVYTWAKELEVNHALFVFDSCFSGTILKVRGDDSVPPYIEESTAEPVRQFITGGKANEKLPAKSVFTPAFVNALRLSKGDLNKDGYATGLEICYHLKNEVPKYWPQHPQCGTIRDYEFSLGDFVFVVGSGQLNAGSLTTPSINHSSTTPTSHKVVNITLPNDFVQALGGADVLIGKMTLVGCGNVQINKANNNTFSTTCPKKPRALKITGFLSIAPFSDGTFHPSSQNIYSKEIRLFHKKNSAVTNLTLTTPSKDCKTTPASGNKFRFHYQCIGKELSFKKQGENCGYKGTLSLEALENGKLILESGDCDYVYLVSPFKVSTDPATSPTNGRCQLLRSHPIEGKKLTNQVLKCNSAFNKFELNWNGWEPIEVTVVDNTLYTNIQASQFKPIWPFTNRNWALSSAYATGGTPSCDVTPKYVKGMTKTYPTLEKWTTGTSLPTEISVTVKQQPQSGKIAKAYKETATISWKPSDVARAGQWDLLTTPQFASQLKKETSTVTFNIADSSLRGSRIFQYGSLQACRYNQDAEEVDYFDRPPLRKNVSPCASFRLKDESSDKFVSHCAQANESNEVFFKPSSCGKKRKLVVISTSKDLETHHFGGRALKSSLIRVLQQTKTIGTKIPPFTVVTINSGRAVSEPLLTCEEMGEGVTASSKLGQLSFGATDLHVRDLDYVHSTYNPEQLDSVFYLVEDVPDNVDMVKDFAIPRAWKEFNIPLTVLTINERSCRTWRDKRVANAKCYTLGQTELALKGFLGIQ